MTGTPRKPAGTARARQAQQGLRKNIVWLASYPKSGNTWTRIFLANYLVGGDRPVPINQIHRIGMGDAVPKAYAMVARGPIDPGDHRAMLALRPGVLRAIATNGADVNFVKTHNLRDRAMGVELIPPPLTRAAIYILRNPLDIVLSYARHYAMTPEQVTAAIGRDDNTIAGGDLGVPQYLGSWSKHVRSWTRRAPFPVLALRYEDMQADPAAAFSKVLELIGITPDPERLSRAVRFSSFEEVSRQERDHGFIEKSPTAERFFHTGRAGAWTEALSSDLADRVRADHGEVMRAQGYL